MEDLLNAVLNRESLQLEATESYAAILGAAPSKGARSPALWNRAFRALNISATMYPMDVAPEGLSEVVNALRNDPRFIGGAVAVPYKQGVVRYMDDVEDEAQAIGAVNAIYRRGSRLVGANTDGAAALMSVRRLMSESQLSGATVVVLGIGGAGRAVAAFLAKAIGPSGRMFLANRTVQAGDFAERLRNFCQVEMLSAWPVSSDVLARADLIVNCTSIGSELIHTEEGKSYSLLGYSPLASIGEIKPVLEGNDVYERFSRENHRNIIANIDQSWQALLSVRKAAVYDIVYQPKQTVLLTLARTRGLRCLAGKMMNLDQAVIAFIRSVEAILNDALEVADIRKLMMTS